MDSEDITLSVVIPVYNEADKIEKTLFTIINYLKDKYPYEIIVVDDGSNDETYSIIERLAKDYSCIRAFNYKINRGKGYALKRGMSEAKGKYVLFTDADLSTPFEEIEKFFPYFEEGYEVVVGSRRLKDSKIEIHQSWYRELMGKVFFILAKILVLRGIHDFNCGFKCYTQKAAHHLYRLGRIERWGFDVEIFYLAKKYGYKIKEVPVRWLNAPTTKARLIRDSINSFLELLRIRINDIKKLYEE